MAFSEERAVELGFARKDLGARGKSRSVDGSRVVRNRKPAKWAGRGTGSQQSGREGGGQGLSISATVTVLFRRELSSSGE